MSQTPQEIIEHRLEDLRHELDHLNGTDPGVLSDEERARHLGRKQEVQAQIDAFEAAKVRVLYGTYGICDRCETAIDPERLAFKPEAPYCMACQIEVEKAYRKGGGR